MPPAFAADLSDNALIAVTGDDARSFLHAQFTSDVEALAAGQAQWSGWCTAKGRLVATFLLLRRADDFLIMLPGEIAAAFVRRLSMFVLRAKVKIADASDAIARIGIAGDGASSLVRSRWGSAPAPMRAVERDGATCVALDEERFVAFGPADLAARFPRGTRDGWEWAMIQAGVPIVVAATQEAFVPQMANLELVGGVSFKKGCYPGQEIVARTQYRGILKRRMALAHVGGGERPQPGQSVYSAAFGEQSAGTIVNAAPSPAGGYDALVVAQVESLARADLRWNSPDGPAMEIRKVPVPASAA
ncbi:MAG TPA: folate-binding protein [Usitatibacter sp.]|nr:folate-binding protein [Usitatibacter sp.]